MKYKKILYFCSAYPYPIDDGIKKINANLISEFINNGMDVTLIVPDEGSISSEYFSGLKVIKYKKQRSIFKMIKDLFLLRPLYFSLYFDSNLVVKIEKNCYDLIFYDFYPLTVYSSNLKNEIFMMPDSMKELAYSNFKNEKNLIKRLYSFLNYILSIMYNFRIHSLKKLYVSKEDIELDNLKNSYLFKIPADNFNFKEYQGGEFNLDEILFRGVMDFEPNLTAIENFYENIFLQLIKKYPNLKLKIVGKNPPKSLSMYMIKNTIITGFVDNIFKEMSQSGIHIVPMNSGTGVKTKMLDSIMLKRIIFATPKSINGIFDSVEEALDNGIVIYKNVNEFFYFYEKLISNEINYKEMTNKAYDFLNKNSYSKKIDELFKIVGE